jgi:hypothetical protein
MSDKAAKPLTAWSEAGIANLRARQLVAHLYSIMLAEGRSAVDARWVAERCRDALKSKNPSQKLKDALGLTCGEIAARVMELARCAD